MNIEAPPLRTLDRNKGAVPARVNLLTIPSLMDTGPKCSMSDNLRKRLRNFSFPDALKQLCEVGPYHLCFVIVSSASIYMSAGYAVDAAFLNFGLYWHELILGLGFA